MIDTKTSKPISKIKALVSTMTLEQKKDYRKELLLDDRKAIQQIVKKIDKEVMAFEAECLRTSKMYDIEKNLEGVTFVAGVDEVGRGPLAGPVVAACVILPKEEIKFLNDSKKVKESLRETLFDEIMDKAIAVGIGVVDNQRIDQVNILNATKEAMTIAIESIDQSIDHLLIDAVHLESVKIPQSSIIKGDEKAACIAAASIIAKVTRDRMMLDFDKIYPEYDFAGNKGYGTKNHYSGLDSKGITPIHRMSFLKKYCNQ